jgi:hypothetical protein
MPAFASATPGQDRLEQLLMYPPAQRLSSFRLHLLLIIAIASAAITSAPAFGSSGEVAAEGNGSGAANASNSSYRWNLSNENLPLINLPDHIGGGLDLSFTYSLDQFEFPLFQSLYYNQRTGKYLLMVIRKDQQTSGGGVSSEQNVRAEFIELATTNAPEVETSSNSHLQLTGKGSLKTLSTSDGVVYSFVPLADGELHCSQIKDHSGLVISLKYTGNSSIQSIDDGAGRKISFGYTNDYVSSITQTWHEQSAKLKQTWSIADEVKFAHPSAHPGLVVPEPVKHIPSNAIKPAYTEAMSASDSMLAAIFGGPGAVAAANGFEPARLAGRYPLYRGDLVGDDGRLLRGHLSFAMHLYGSADGTQETAVYIPAGFTSHSNEPTPSDAVVTFYYPRLGNLSDVTLAVFHVANFQVSEEGGRVRIGSIGGRGGSADSYKHSHIEFYRGNTGLPRASCRDQLRIDPATVFASGN